MLRWLKKLEEIKGALNFAQDAFDKFKEGDFERKKEVFRSLGSNLCLIDKKLFIKAENKLLGLNEVSSEVKTISRRLEPLDCGLKKEKLELAYSSNPVLLRIVYNVRTITKQPSGYIYIPDSKSII